MAQSRPARIVRAPFARLLVGLGVRLQRLSAAIGAASLPRFAASGPGLEIRPPFEIRHPERIYLGRDVKLGPNSSLKAITHYPGSWVLHPQDRHVSQAFQPELHIGDRVTATSALYVAVFQRIDIEDDVMFAGNVFVADGTHAFERGDVPYKYQGVASVAPVRIGRGSWIGQNAVISPGVTIGPMAIVGANAVVTRDVPAGCVAMGVPARVVRRWSDAEERWLPVDGDRGAEHGRVLDQVAS